MSSSLREFVSVADRTLDLVRPVKAVGDPQLLLFMENKRRLEFFRDLVGRARILAYCYESLWTLTDRCREFQRRLRDLPYDPPDSHTRTMPAAWAEEEKRWLEEVDAIISLVYYEVTSIVGMLRQLDIGLDYHQEVKFLVKVRDRFFSHVQLSGVRRGQGGGWSLPATGYLKRDIVALNSWYSEDLRALGSNAVEIGSPQWKAQRRTNEQLLLSNKHNEDFTQQELVELIAAGVRECDLELVHQQLANLLTTQLMPLITAEAEQAIRDFGFERWSE